MTSALQQLQSIFEDKSTRELEIALLHNGNDVAAAVEAIFNGATTGTSSRPTRDASEEDELPGAEAAPAVPSKHSRTKNLLYSTGANEVSAEDTGEGPMRVYRRESRERAEAAISSALEASMLTQKQATTKAGRGEPHSTKDRRWVHRIGRRHGAKGGHRITPIDANSDEEEVAEKVVRIREKLHKEREEAELTVAFEASTPEKGLVATVGGREAETKSPRSKLTAAPAQLQCRKGKRQEGRDGRLRVSRDDTRDKSDLEQGTVESMSQEELEEQEDAALKAALETSMDPSDRGRLAMVGKKETDTVSDRSLSMLLKDPAFLECIEDDLRAAIELQTKLDQEEMALALKSGDKVSPGSLAPIHESNEIQPVNEWAGIRRKSSQTAPTPHNSVASIDTSCIELQSPEGSVDQTQTDSSLALPPKRTSLSRINVTETQPEQNSTNQTQTAPTPHNAVASVDISCIELQSPEDSVDQTQTDSSFALPPKCASLSRVNVAETQPEHNSTNQTASDSPTDGLEPNAANLSSSVKDRLKSLGANFLRQIEEVRETARLIEQMEAMNKENDREKAKLEEQQRARSGTEASRAMSDRRSGGNQRMQTGELEPECFDEKEHQEAVDQMKAMNRECERERAKLEEQQRARSGAEAGRLRPAHDHLETYLSKHPAGNYEEWIRELNPESFDERKKEAISESFYEETSEFRKAWNEAVLKHGLSARSFVRARTCPSTSAISAGGTSNEEHEKLGRGKESFSSAWPCPATDGDSAKGHQQHQEELRVERQSESLVHTPKRPTTDEEPERSLAKRFGRLKGALHGPCPSAASKETPESERQKESKQQAPPCLTASRGCGYMPAKERPRLERQTDSLGLRHKNLREAQDLRFLFEGESVHGEF